MPDLSELGDRSVGGAGPGDAEALDGFWADLESGGAFCRCTCRTGPASEGERARVVWVGPALRVRDAGSEPGG